YPVRITPSSRISYCKMPCAVSISFVRMILPYSCPLNRFLLPCTLTPMIPLRGISNPKTSKLVRENARILGILRCEEDLLRKS
ncbi:MAG: hypothetical protein K2H40_15020, partial [Lachnospiraceae bacterium]|nr:hypothetical protein [Lachnospiraceae bacterium]